MTPEQAHFLLQEVYLPQLRNEQKTTRRVIEAVPADKLGYAPDPKSMDAWKLAKHIASSEIFFMLGTAGGEFKRENGNLPDTVTTPADLGKWYAEAFEKAAAKLASTAGADLVKTVPFAIFSFPAIAYIGLNLSHVAHHRGQLSAYLRPMGAKVPSIYGPSGDDAVEAAGSH